MVSKVGPRLRVGPAPRQVVLRRHNQRLLQLRGPARRRPAPRQDRHTVDRRTRRRTRHHLRRVEDHGEPLRQRPEGTRPEGRRPRHHLHADGPGGRRGHARLRPPGYRAQRRLRWLLLGSAQGPHTGPGRGRSPHRRWWLAPWQGSPLERCRRPGTRRLPHRERRHRPAPHWLGIKDARRPRPLVARTRGHGRR